MFCHSVPPWLGRQQGGDNGETSRRVEAWTLVVCVRSHSRKAGSRKRSSWSQPAGRIERMRRALEPWPRTTAFLARSGGDPLRLVLEDVAVDPDHAAAAAGVAPGTILAAGDAGIVVACGGGTALAVRRVVPEGRRGMTAAEFLRGHPVLPGMRFDAAPRVQSRPS
ncbi:MAG: hypothetical protein ACKOBP_04495 [Planctomycetia bacterium]